MKTRPNKVVFQMSMNKASISLLDDGNYETHIAKLFLSNQKKRY